MAWTYTTKDIVTGLYKMDASILQDEWSDWAESLIDKYVGYKSMGVATTRTDEVHNGSGSSSVYVKYPPITSVTSLAIGSSTPSTLDSTSYKVFDDHIQLTNYPSTELETAIFGVGAVFPVGVHNITITYVSGLISIPYPVQLSATQMIGEIAKFNMRGNSDSSQKYTPQTNTTGQGQGVVAIRGLSSTLQSIMKLNLRKRVTSLA